MPFDASGNFTRVYNFVQDASNGIKILAARVDGEFDNIATGMNAVFFRDGRVPMQADLRMNVNGITGLKDGALGSPAIKFNTDAGTGPYLPGLNQYGIQVNSVQRGVFTTAGLDVTGNLTNTGTHISTGNVTAPSFIEGATALTAKYAQLGAGNTFTGNLTAPGFVSTGVGGAGHFINPRDGTTGQIALYSNTANTFRINENSVDQFILSPTGLTVVPGATFQAAVAVTGGITSGNTTSTGSLTMDGPTNSARGLTYRGAGGFVSSIQLLSDNATMEYAVTGGPHMFRVNGAQQFSIGSGSASVVGTALYVNTNKLLMQHDGTTGYVRAETGDLYLGSVGTNVLRVQNNGTITQVQSGGTFNNVGGGGSYNIGYSNSRTGQVGYHMYNNGAVTEWVIYQPAHASGDDFRIATGAAGALTDRMTISTAGQANFNSHVIVNGNMAVNGSNGQISFNSRTGNVNCSLYNVSNVLRLEWGAGDKFTVDNVGNVVAAGNISSSSDARLKSNVRDLTGALDMVRQLQPKRFTMNNKADFGFIAQEALPVVPEVVNVDANGYMSLDYARLTAVLAGAIKSLDDRLTRAGL
jgi:hypothetical protein